MADQIIQRVYAYSPEPNHELKDVLTASQFIDLLVEEEDYYPGEQHNTRLMFTRLRKIFYDKWGWNKELIRGATSIESRYNVIIVDDPIPHSKPMRYYKKFEYAPKHRSVVYTDHDRVYGNTRTGQPCFIYSSDHQEVVLPDGSYCDLAHILAGVDASNYRQIVTPMPNFLEFLAKLFPYVGFNMDMATWLGDIGSESGDFLFYKLRNKKMPNVAEMQNYIDIDMPGSDTLGDIDAYVINASYDVTTNSGMRVTDILKDYYLTDNVYRRNRVSIFCREIGLGDLKGDKFVKEGKWLKYFKKQLLNETTFQIFSITDEKIHSVWLPVAAWFGFFKDVLKTEELLTSFISALKSEVKKEQSVL